MEHTRNEAKLKTSSASKPSRITSKITKMNSEEELREELGPVEILTVRQYQSWANARYSRITRLIKDPLLFL